MSLVGALRRCSGTGSAAAAADIAAHGDVGGVNGVRFGGQREINDCLCQGQLAFGVSEEVHHLSPRAKILMLRERQVDVLDGHANDSAGAVHGVFASFQHAAKPIQRGIGVAVADAFVQQNDVVVLLALLVVQQNPAL